jgi:hypothetical protein
LSDLPSSKYHAVLNFASWADENVLADRLKPGALGYATTVHPLLSNFDAGGWLPGAWRTFRDFSDGKKRAAAKGARYGWVVFKPDEAALNALVSLLAKGVLSLPVGIVVPLGEAARAFDHVARQRPGRAALLP